MTLFCLLSCGFTVVLLDVDEDLDVVFLLGLYGMCVLDLLQSLEWVDKAHDTHSANSRRF